MFGSERERKLWRICKCVYGGGSTLTGWHGEELAAANLTALTVRDLLCSRYFECVSSDWQQGPLSGSHVVGRARGRRLWRQDTAAEVRHFKYHDGRWLNNPRWTKETRNLQGHIQETASLPGEASCDLSRHRKPALYLQKLLTKQSWMSRWRYVGNTVLTHGINLPLAPMMLCGNHSRRI